MKPARLTPLKLFGFIAIADCLLIGLFALLGIGDPFSFLFEEPRPGELRNTFMDHFHSMWNSYVRGLDGEYDSIYPPLVELAYLVLSHIFIAPGTGDGYHMRNGDSPTTTSTLSIALLETIVVAALVLIALAIAKRTHRAGIEPYLGSFSLVFTVPLIYALERGNSMLACTVFLLLFLLFYQCESRNSRFIAAITLAIAINIKLYPAIFLLVYATDRRWREFAWAAAASAMLFIVPFFLYSGVQSMGEFLKNLLGTTGSFSTRGYGNAVGLANTVNFLGSWLTGNVDFHIPNKAFALLLALSALLFILALTKSEQRMPLWETLLFCGCFIALFPTFSYVYNLSFIIPGVFTFLCVSDSLNRKRDVVLFILICLALLSVPFNVADVAPGLTAQLEAGETDYILPLSLGTLVNSIALAAIWILLCADFARWLLREKPA